ncbi:hypothetical protein A1O3_02102 [Capronia epimyces CBS 606.96]|uniref:Glyoxalase-like domain-containing protein n=1 Tax=Capronia epimyces CBS 606.96 TaxID=1182542 RepID=W9Y926_9EURO|nr:uncharacterized protein A1O3_02102 [Capronia epimyces CBS 606.96]EXJ89038.1 hypothetical protein A1O3_02102 [Capronia epimyces CBS 606.96]
MSADIRISEYAHDHVILVLDTPDFENPPAWLSDNFNIIEGGTHAGGSSRNKLIVFADGTYIELLNWISEPKEFFDWAGKPPGLIDFALTTPQSAQETHAAATKRLESSPSPSDEQGADAGVGDGGLGVRFKQPLFGGRRRKDGQQVEWYVTKPAFDNEAPNVGRPADRFFPTGRLDTPFFCHDVTDRLLRVPYKDPSISTHPCGAKAILSVLVLVPDTQIDNYAALYAAVTGARPSVHPGHRDKPTTTRAIFHLSAPDPEADVAKALNLTGRVGIELRGPRDGRDEDWLKRRGVGIAELRLLVPAEGGRESEDKVEVEVDTRPLDTEGIGASVVLVVEPPAFLS